ncbi:hypothetical protein JMJ35_004329 [Cladonia borealis]|uniref:5'-3' DNA helicase ZGRF1-like N-terminal domain-containing protein n=1 Tax=Cladonia borealis TaxID=184061 RepID=A0AA39V2D2_9LECA|nr:hypothetical protein JMJ35_004329 [Cladonia borealis]
MTSTAVASTAVRPTQNLIVPTTQNTAPVLDFKCLYSYDLRRKQKRWQDGLLRFHTFNKRIMVYDVPRNYIGDTHWRDDDIIGDGDEFELDRGVLIQVGEAAGSMEQDLTELLEKRHPISGQATSSPMGDPLTTTMASPAVPQTSFLRPKSLNTLLGTPKGPIGRASMPKKSPHEMRKGRNDIDCTVERPAKRPRLADSSAVVSTPVIPQIRRSSPNPNKPTPLGGEQERFGRKHVSRHGENDFSTSGITAPSSPKGQRLYTVTAPVSHDKMSARKPRGDKCVKSTRKQRERGQEETRERIGATLPGIDHAQPRPTINAATGSLQNSLTSWEQKSAESVEVISGVEAVPSSEPRITRTKLQMASRKPRRKLMYRDLLPQDSSAISRSVSSTKCTAQDGPVTNISSGSEQRSKEPLTEFHQKESDQLADRLNRRPSNEDARNAGHNNKDSSKSMSPSLFFAQEDSWNHWIECHRTTDDLADTRNIRHIADMSEEHFNLGRSSRALKTRPRSIPKASSTIHDTELTLLKMDEILFSRPQSKPPLTRKPKEPADPFSPTRGRSSSPIPSTPQTLHSSRPPQDDPPPKKSPSSSPAPKTPSSALPLKPSTRPLHPLPPSPPTNHITTSPSYPLNPLPKPPPLTTRPPKARSPLKKAISDPSNMRPPPPLASVINTETEKGKDATSEQNGNGSAWGKEAWDLFGCGRDGVECTYEEFKRKEGLL